LSVDFKGFVNDPSPFIIDSDFVFVSRYLGILEAFANNRYVFAIYNNEIKQDYLEVTPFAKYMTIASSANDLTNEYLEIAQDPSKRIKKTEEAYKWVKTRTWEKLTGQYLSLWNKE